MIRYFQHRFALSRKGAQDLAKGIAWTTVLNVGFMLPAIFTFLFLEDYLQGSATHGCCQPPGLLWRHCFSVS